MIIKIIVKLILILHFGFSFYVAILSTVAAAMGEDHSRRVFGLFHKPALLAVLAIDFYIVCFPSPDIGKYAMDLIQRAMFLSQVCFSK